jgi:Ca2+-binding EF-hand superfamily protein
VGTELNKTIMTRPLLLASSCAILLLTSPALLAEDAAPDKREAMFKRLDTNGDGSISKEEWMASKGAQKNPERAAKKFTSMDKDSDGNVSKEEYTKVSGGGEKSDTTDGGEQ